MVELTYDEVQEMAERFSQQHFSEPWAQVKAKWQRGEIETGSLEAIEIQSFLHLLGQ